MRGTGAFLFFIIYYFFLVPSYAMNTTKKTKKLMRTPKIFMMSHRLDEMRLRYLSRCVCALSTLAAAQGLVQSRSFNHSCARLKRCSTEAYVIYNGPMDQWTNGPMDQWTKSKDQ